MIREELLSVINRGAEALIADMTATVSCDHVGAEAVARAWQRAVVTGAELRLVITSRIVSRVLSLSSLDRLVSTYPSLEAAVAASRVLAAVPAPAASTALPITNGQGQSRPAGRTTGQFPQAGPPDGNGSAIPPAVAWKLLDALRVSVSEVVCSALRSLGYEGTRNSRTARRILGPAGASRGSGAG